MFKIGIDGKVDNGGYLINNGHTVQYNPTKKFIYDLEFEGKSYEFKQFHHHYKSENMFEGNDKKVEIHFVHVNDALGKIAVIGVLFDDEVNETNPFLAQFDERLPHEEHHYVWNVAIDFKLLFDISDMNNFYHFTGSLTTPPCSEDVMWFVYKDVQPATTMQLKKFDLFTTSNAPNGNQRQIQDLNGRKVYNVKGFPVLPPEVDTQTATSLSVVSIILSILTIVIVSIVLVVCWIPLYVVYRRAKFNKNMGKFLDLI